LLKYLRNSKSKSFTLILVLTLLLLNISGFSKSYIPVITKDSGTAIVEGCHEQVDHSTLKNLVQNVFENSEEKDCCEKVCFCCSTNLRSNLKFVLIESNFRYLNRQAKLLKESDKVNVKQHIFNSFNNKSPPYLHS
jgi:hypothetical protein